MRSKDTILLESLYNRVLNENEEPSQETTPQENTQDPKGSQDVQRVINQWKTLLNQRGEQVTADDQTIRKVGQLAVEFVKGINKYVAKNDGDAKRIDNAFKQARPDEAIKQLQPFNKNQVQEGKIKETFQNLFTKAKRLATQGINFAAFAFQMIYIVLLAGVGTSLGFIPFVILAWVIYHNPKVLNAIWFLPEGGVVNFDEPAPKTNKSNQSIADRFGFGSPKPNTEPPKV